MTFKITLTVSDDDLAGTLRSLDLCVSECDTQIEPVWPHEKGALDMTDFDAAMASVDGLGKVLAQIRAESYEPPTITEIEVPISWPRTGLSRACPSCDAPEGEPCVTKGGNWAQTMHRGRLEAE